MELKKKGYLDLDIIVILKDIVKVTLSFINTYILYVLLFTSVQENKLLDLWEIATPFLILYSIIVIFKTFFRTSETPLNEADILEVKGKMIMKNKKSIDSEIIICHEAGHAVMAEILNIPVKEIIIESKGNCGGGVVLDIPSISTTKNLKKFVLINYAGYMAEKIYLKEVSDGCMGDSNADIEVANEYIRRYIILTDRSISLTGYESDYIQQKTIALSKEWIKETERLLTENKEKLLEKIKIITDAHLR